MIGLQVPKNQAEKVRRLLIRRNLLDTNFKPKAENNFIIFPILKKPRIKSCKTVNIFFDEAKKIEDYKEILKNNISAEQLKLLPSSFDVIGDIIIIEIKKELAGISPLIGKALLKAHPSIKTVLKKSGIHSGEFRTQKLGFLAGHRKKETIYRENGALIRLNVEKVYFSPRLSSERKRIFKQIKKNETILVMFSGSGVYPIVISRNSEAKRIVGIEKNPIAHEYALKNLELNKIKNVVLLKGDVRTVVPAMKEKFDRIIMPLPKDAQDFLNIASFTWGKNTVVHLYGFSHIDNLNETGESISSFCTKRKIKFKILKTTKCGQYSPCKFRVCVDFMVL